MTTTLRHSVSMLALCLLLFWTETAGAYANSCEITVTPPNYDITAQYLACRAALTSGTAGGGTIILPAGDMILDPGAGGFALCAVNRYMVIRGQGLRATRVHVPDNIPVRANAVAWRAESVAACDIRDATFSANGKFAITLAVFGQTVLRDVLAQNATYVNLFAKGVQSVTWQNVRSYYQPLYHAPQVDPTLEQPHHGILLEECNALTIHGLFSHSFDGDGVLVRGRWRTHNLPFDVPAPYTAGDGYPSVYGGVIESMSGDTALRCDGAQRMSISDMVIEMGDADGYVLESRCDEARIQGGSVLMSTTIPDTRRYLRVSNSRNIQVQWVRPTYSFGNFHVALVGNGSRSVWVEGFTLTGNLYRQLETEWTDGGPSWFSTIEQRGWTSLEQPPAWILVSHGTNVVLNQDPSAPVKGWVRHGNSQPWTAF